MDLLFEAQIIEEIIRQIFDEALSLPPQLRQHACESLPDFRKVIGADLMNDQVRDLINQATSELGFLIYELISLQRIPIIGDNHGIAYVFHRLVGNDIYLKLLV